MTPAELARYREKVKRKKERAEYQRALVEWLSQWPWEWSMAVTLKPRKNGHPHRFDVCKRHVEGLMSELSSRLFGRRWRRRRKGVFGMVFWELQQRGEYHAHILMAGAAGRGKFLGGLHHYCNEHSVLGFMWAKPVNDGKAVEYAAKYVTKRGGDFGVFGVRWFDDRDVPTPLVEALRRECETKRA